MHVYLRQLWCREEYWVLTRRAVTVCSSSNKVSNQTTKNAKISSSSERFEGVGLSDHVHTTRELLANEVRK